MYRFYNKKKGYIKMRFLNSWWSVTHPKKKKNCRYCTYLFQRVGSSHQRLPCRRSGKHYRGRCSFSTCIKKSVRAETTSGPLKYTIRVIKRPIGPRPPPYRAIIAAHSLPLLFRLVFPLARRPFAVKARVALMARSTVTKREGACYRDGLFVWSAAGASI